MYGVAAASADAEGEACSKASSWHHSLGMYQIYC